MIIMMFLTPTLFLMSGMQRPVMTATNSSGNSASLASTACRSGSGAECRGGTHLGGGRQDGKVGVGAVRGQRTVIICTSPPLSPVREAISETVCRIFPLIFNQSRSAA